MVLIECDECGREISDSASVCPGCGYPQDWDMEDEEEEYFAQESLREEKTLSLRKISIYFLFFLFLLVLGTCVYTASNIPEVSNSPDKWNSYQQSSNWSTKLVKRCAREAGIPESDPKHAVTPEEMIVLTACIDREMPSQ